MKGLLSNIEYFVIGVMAIIFVVWAVSKCSSHKQTAQEIAAEEAREDSIATAKSKPLPDASSATATRPDTTKTTAATPAAGTAGAVTTTAAPSATTPAKTAEPAYSKLYVTIDKLKIRKQPGLKGELLGTLSLFDEVFYMNEVTDSTTELSLGKEIVKEPWIKVKTKRGTIGWVYGAGVHYIRKKREGVLE